MIFPDVCNFILREKIAGIFKVDNLLYAVEKEVNLS